MPLKNRLLPVGTVEFDENTTKKLKIPRNNAIRRMIMKFFVTFVEGNTANPTEIEDTILKIIKRMKLIIDGDDAKFSSDAQKWFYFEKYSKRTEPYTNKDSVLGQNASIKYEVTLTADFAINKLDLSDISALLPAKKYSQLELEIEWGAVSDVFSANASGVTITDASSGCYVEILEVIDTDNPDDFATGKKTPFADIRQQIDSLSITTTYPNLEESALARDVKPVPNLVRSHLIALKNSSGVLTTANVSKFAIVNTVGAGETLYRSETEAYERMLKAELGLESIDDGILFLDHVELQRGGIANVGNEGDYKLKFLVAVGSGSIELLTEYVAGTA